VWNHNKFDPDQKNMVFLDLGDDVTCESKFYPVQKNMIFLDLDNLTFKRVNWSGSKKYGFPGFRDDLIFFKSQN